MTKFAWMCAHEGEQPGGDAARRRRGHPRASRL